MRARDSGGRRRGRGDRLRSAGPSVLKVSCADKIDNARALTIDVRRLGDRLWERFNSGRDAQLWNYRTLARIFAERREDLGPDAAWLADELGRQVEELERAALETDGD